MPPLAYCFRYRWLMFLLFILNFITICLHSRIYIYIYYKEPKQWEKSMLMGSCISVGLSSTPLCRRPMPGYDVLEGWGQRWWRIVSIVRLGDPILYSVSFGIHNLVFAYWINYKWSSARSGALMQPSNKLAGDLHMVSSLRSFCSGYSL